MGKQIELQGRFRIANDDGFRKRKGRLARAKDPRLAFYDAMLRATTFEQYEATVGSLKVMPNGRKDGPFSGHDEMLYALKRHWITKG